MLPDAFERCLKRYDPKLGLRRSDSMGCWVIDRLAARIHPHELKLAKYAVTVPDATPQAHEEWRSLSRGRRALFYADVLDNRTIDKIRLRDLQKRGSAALEENLARRGKKMDEARKAAHERARHAADVVYHLARKRADDLRPEKTQELFMQALGMPVEKRQPYSIPGHVGKPDSLFDAFNRPLLGSTHAKIHLATR